jgi:hypothetical protein
MSQFGPMGQTLDLAFIGHEEILLDILRKKLTEIGIVLKQANPALDWVEWIRPSGEKIALAANTHLGLNRSWVILSFDSHELGSLPTLEGRKSLVDHFLDLGIRLWSTFKFSEGILAPEEGGLFLSIAKRESIQQEHMRFNYASFFSREVVDLAKVHEWAHQKYPRASFQSLPEEGVLIVWDSSKEGLARFFEDSFT